MHSDGRTYEYTPLTADAAASPLRTWAFTWANMGGVVTGEVTAISEKRAVVNAIDEYSLILPVEVTLEEGWMALRAAPIKAMRAAHRK
jgi:hypothetical protein